MLSKLKLLLNIQDGSSDELLSLYLEIATQKALNYCNRPDIPTGLELIIVEMAANQYQAQKTAEAGGTAASIKRGDTTIQYEKKESAEGDITKNYAAQLARFAKIKVI